MPKCVVSWWSEDGEQQTLVDVPLLTVPRVGDTLDLSEWKEAGASPVDVSGEWELRDLGQMKVIDVCQRVGLHAAISIGVERPASVRHRREIAEKQAIVDGVRMTATHLLAMLNQAVPHGVRIQLEGSGEKRDLITMHLLESLVGVVDLRLVEMVDDAYAYPDLNTLASGMCGARRRLKQHGHPELVWPPR